jgi:hypothetical protein
MRHRSQSLHSLMMFTIALAAAQASCGRSVVPPNACPVCASATGAVQITVALTASDVARVVATVTGAGISTPLSSDLTIGGSPLSASGEIANVPTGAQQTVTLVAYPAGASDPEGGIVIYQGQTQVAITAGQIADASLTLFPVVGDVAVSAKFAPGDIDVSRIDHTSVVVTGNRIEAPAMFYLQLSIASNTATGVAQRIPVGSNRTVTVTSFAIDGTQLHRGNATTSVNASGATVAVSMVNTTGQGAVSLDGGFCAPACGSAVCGSDGCGGSCGGCQTNATCTAGTCVGPAPCRWQAVATYSLTSAPPGSHAVGGAAGVQQAEFIGGRTAYTSSADWMDLDVPDGLPSGNDLFAINIDVDRIGVPATVRLTGITLFVDPNALGDRPGVWVGWRETSVGLRAIEWLLPTAQQALQGWLPNDPSAQVTSSTSVTTSTDSWHTLRIEGSRSQCKLWVSIDGTAISSFSQACSLTGSFFALYVEDSNVVTPVGAAWSNMTVFSSADNAACLP